MEAVGSASGGGRTVASVGVGHFMTRMFGFAFPQMLTYQHDFVRRVKKVDPTLRVHYPWSIVRIGVWVGIPLMILMMAVL